MTVIHSSAGARDTLRMTIVKDECVPGCPADRARKGDVSATALRVGDTVSVRGKQVTISEITTGMAGKTGLHLICGRRHRLAAALLLLSDGETCYVDSDITKLCPDCGLVVTRFR